MWSTELTAQEHCSRQFSGEFISSSSSPFYSKLENCYDVNFYDIEIEISDTASSYTANTGVVFTSLKEIDSLVLELQDPVQIDSITLNSLYIPYFEHVKNLVWIYPEDPIVAGSVNKVKIWYRGGDANGGFFAGITSRTDFTYSKRVTYTLSEPFQSNSWFPVKQNLNDKADSVRITIITDSTLMGGSNGLLKEKKILNDGKTGYTWQSRYPIAFYLISIAVADYFDYSFYVPLEGTGDSLLVQNLIYDHPEILNNEKERIDRTSDMISLFNELFGLYPFANEKYGHSMAPMGGGMEHQTMTTLQNFNFDLVSHELAHQWFGDHVTCGTWQDIWINEGFASYAEYLAREYLMGLPEAVTWMQNAHGYALRAEDGSVYLTEEEASDVSRIFSYALTYKKGASILHMLRNEINNDNLFFQIFREFQVRFADSNATAEDFAGIVNELTGEDYSWFFDQWYYGKGFPILQSTWKERADSLYIEVYQGSSSDNPKFFRMHIDFLVEFTDGTDSLYRVLIDEPQNKFSLGLRAGIESIQMDPYNNNLMTSTIYEYIPENYKVEINPNPFSDQLYLDFQNPATRKSVMISNLQGKILYDMDLGKVDSAELNLSYLSGGIYLLVIKEDNRRNATRIVKL